MHCFNYSIIVYRYASNTVTLIQILQLKITPNVFYCVYVFLPYSPNRAYESYGLLCQECDG